VTITVTDEIETTPTNTRYIAAATTYENLDLQPGGTGVTTVSSLNSADDEVATIDLGGNSFRFYDAEYTNLTIDSNGRIILGNGESDFENTDLTSSTGPTPGIIAPFWDDLNLSTTVATADTPEDDLVLYKIDGNRLILEWNNAHFFAGGTTTDGLTFQAILQLNTGTDNGIITFNYVDLTEENLTENNGSSATVGIKAPGSQTNESTDRTLISFNQTNALVGNGQAILLTPETIDPNEPVIVSGNAVSIAENTTDPFYTAMATAPDGAFLTYGLSGTDADLFLIDPNTGVVSFANAPDFEAPADEGGDNVYNITVTAANGNLIGSQDVTITVTDEVEGPPSNTQYFARTTTYENLDLLPGATDVVTITELSAVDDEVATIDLGGNSFRFYDAEYTSLTIDSNGRIILGNGESDYENTDLTSSAGPTPGIIAPFWDDLNLSTTVATADTADDDLVLYKIDGNRLILEWNNAHFFNGGNTTDGLTFQAILQLNTGTDNGDITFNYVDLTEEDLAENNGASATVGIKAPGSQTNESTDRTLVSFDETSTLVGSGKAILLTTTPTTVVSTSGPDFNDDGNLDLLWRNKVSGLNAIWYMDGNSLKEGTLLDPRVADPNWNIEGIGDFDQDGQEDLLWRNYSSGYNAIWYMDGGNLKEGIFLEPRIADTNWKIEGVGDFNQDGHQDLMWRHYGTGHNAIWLMEGSTLKEGILLDQRIADTKWEVEGVGDFNQDGHDDLLWRHYGSGHNAIWLMEGTNLKEGMLLEQRVADTNWHIEGVGDFNQDGHSDIFWRHYGSGQNSIWYMNGTALTSGQILDTTLTDTNWQAIV
jgi:hypothetical protein